MLITDWDHSLLEKYTPPGSIQILRDLKKKEKDLCEAVSTAAGNLVNIQVEQWWIVETENIHPTPVASESGSKGFSNE